MNQKPLTKGALVGAYLVPGMPHLLRGEQNDGYAALAATVRQIGEEIRARGAQRIVYYSTQWLSVLGTSFQAKAELSGLHVDDNWHEWGDLPFSFQVDVGFAKRAAKAAEGNGFACALVDFNGFPVDTGTIVANRLLNPGQLPVGMVSSHVYSDGAATGALGASIREAIEADGTPTAVVGVSLLSGRFFTTEIRLSEDHIRDPLDDQWNRRVIALLGSGDHRSVAAILPTYAAEARVDMGFKAYAWLAGVLGTETLGKVDCLAYGPLCGAGAAVMAFR